MQIIDSKKELRPIIRRARRSGQTIGLVPTMGFLHEGHLSLMRRARRENDLVVVSVFVNPSQFGPNEDLDAYPRDHERDKELMAGEKVDLMYFPTVEDLYPDGFTTFVEVEGPMTRVMCGRSRPIHFRGVTTIVAKLFNLATPDRAYFGQKDAQQAAVIQQMARDLNFDLDVVICETVREADGLAMSSRNSYLTPRQRVDALAISRSLFEAREMIEKGERRSAEVIRRIESRVNETREAVIDYVVVVDARTLADLETVRGEILIAAAVVLGNARLIDNVRMTLPRDRSSL
ncbi:MAG: pantoate--beta-alanine ligase [Desulfobacterales bacterium]|nr:pantoate--beta-alanine ligase [Desulfobacterales bacterium]